MTDEVFGKRFGADDELWCSFLVPLCIVCSNYLTEAPGIHAALCVMGISLIVALYCNAIYSAGQRVPEVCVWVYYITPVVSIVALHYFTNYCFHVILPTVFGTFYIFNWLFKELLRTCCFSMGEAAVVAESCNLFIAACVFSLQEMLNLSKITVPEVVYFTWFSQVLILGCLLLILLLYQCPYSRSYLVFYPICMFAACIVLSFQSVYLKQNPILWLLYTCCASKKRILLIALWISLVALAVLFVAHHMKKAEKTASTVIRKYFHIIIISIYIPGLVMDPAFLYLASTVTLSIFIILEACRVFLIPPLGPVIANAFTAFIDEKDSGILVLSNIYLLIGCSCPLWLCPPQNGLHISHWSGLVSVGLGDMVAAAAGSTYGRNKWEGSNKTIEGSVCSFVAQSIALVAILYIGKSVTLWNISSVVFASVATSIVEAKTTQVDNLVLPLLMFPILSCVHV